MEEAIKFLTGSGLMSRADAIDIINHFTPKSFRKDDFFVRQGQFSDDYFLVTKGLLRAYSTDPDGQEVTTNFYSPPDVVFEAAAFFNKTISRENIQALTKCEGWEVKYERLNNLFHSLPAFREFGRHILVKNFVASKLRMQSLITQTAEERYTNILATNPGIIQQVPLKYIASFLGIKDSSLSRIRRQLMHA